MLSIFDVPKAKMFSSSTTTKEAHGQQQKEEMHLVANVGWRLVRRQWQRVRGKG